MLHKFLKAVKAVYSSHPGEFIMLVLFLGLAVAAVVALIVWRARRNRRSDDDE